MLDVFIMITPLFTLIVLGFIAGKIGRLPLDGLAWLNFFIVYLALPAMFFRLLSRTPVDEFTHFGFLFRTTLGTFLIFLLSFVIARFLRRHSIQISTIQGLTGAYGNIGYLGPPLAIAAFGPEAAVPVALIFCLDNSMHFTLAPLMMGLGDKKDKKLYTLIIPITRRIATHPFIIATVAGILGAFYQFVPPSPIEIVLVRLSEAAAPCALFAMGVTAAISPLKRIPSDLIYLIPIKLVVHPVLLYVLVATYTDVPKHWGQTAVLLASLPVATNVFVMAQQYEVWSERALSAVVISTIFSVFSITLCIYMASNLFV